MADYTIQLEETFLDYPDPNVNAIIVYFSGCNHHCPGCHSPLLQADVNYLETKEIMCQRIIDFAKRADTNKLVFLGGDPIYSKNLALTIFLVNNLKNDFDICIFTGYDINYIKNIGLKGVKYWKCGKFDQTKLRQSKKTDNEYILASSNQDFYDGEYNKLSNNGILTFNL